MNNSISQTQGNLISRGDRRKLNTLERLLLLLPTAGGLVFGVLPLLLGGAFGAALGYPGNDSFVYRLAGAATLGYAVALILGLRQGDWAPLRLVVIGTLTFNPGETFGTVTVMVIGDVVADPSEGFYLDITGASANAHPTAGLSAFATIFDEEGVIQDDGSGDAGYGYYFDDYAYWSYYYGY